MTMTPRTLLPLLCLVFLAAACRDGAPVPAGSPRLQVSDPGTVNEPPGFRTVSERPFDLLVEDGWIYGGDTSRYQTISDPDAPVSPTGVGRTTFPQDFAGGSTALILERSFPGSPAAYVSFWFRVSSQWQDTPYMNDAARLWIAGQPRFFWGFYGPGDGTLRPIALIAGTPTPPSGARWLQSNLDPSVEITPDTWHRVEVLVRANAAGTGNGEYHCWVDGQKVAEYTDVDYVSADEVPLWSIAHWAPAWGGPGETLQEPQTVDIDHLRLSSIPAWPNEPAGFRQLGDQPFEGLTLLNWGIAFNDSGYVTVGADAEAPLSPPRVAQFTYPVGFIGGRAPGTVFRDFYPGTRRLYVGIWWKASDPWQGHPSNVNKIQFLFATGGFGQMYMAMYGSPGGPYDLRVLPGFPGVPPIWRGPNVNNIPVTLGVWHRIEWFVDYEADPNHGTVRWWMDGQLIGDYNDVVFPDRPLVEHQLSPTWGGVDGIKTETDFFWYDHVYISKP